jgi:hypothetical protein
MRQFIASEMINGALSDRLPAWQQRWFKAVSVVMTYVTINIAHRLAISLSLYKHRIITDRR